MIISLTGTQDSVNKTFTASAAFRAGTANLNRNTAQYLASDTAWGLTESSSSVVVLNSAPAADDVIFLVAEPYALAVGSATDPGYRGVQEVRYGASNQTIMCVADFNGLQVNPGTATVKIYRPGYDDTVPQISAAAVNDGATHFLSYVLDASDTAVWFLGENYRAVFSYGSGKSTTVTFEVVRQPLAYNCPITYEDLQKSHVSIPEVVSQEGGNAATIAQNIIMQAWADVLAWIRSHGRRPSLTTGKEDLVQVTLYRAQYLFFAGQVENGSAWIELRNEADKQYQIAKRETVLKYREADSVQPSTDRGFQQPQLLAGNDMAVINWPMFRGRIVGGWRP